MSATSIRKTEINPSNNEKVEVLYQRIGNRWYAFSEQDNDLFFGSIPDEVLAELDATEEVMLAGTNQTLNDGVIRANAKIG